jgi:Ser/Thr protein kinase RdoA (MazF antagonist)
LAGYSSIRPIRETDFDSLPIFLILRHAWATALQLSQIELWGAKAFDDAYFDRALAFVRLCRARHPFA